jgi:hypothetical protein
VGALIDDPKNIAGAMKKLKAGIAKVIMARDAFFTEELRKRDVQPLQGKIEELRKVPEFADLGEEVLARMARAGVITKTPEAPPKPEDKFRGVPGGGRRVPSAGGKAMDDAVNAELVKLGYSVED